MTNKNYAYIHESPSHNRPILKSPVPLTGAVFCPLALRVGGKAVALPVAGATTGPLVKLRLLMLTCLLFGVGGVLRAQVNFQGQADTARQQKPVKPDKFLEQPKARLISGYIYNSFRGKKPVPGASIRVSDGRQYTADGSGFYQLYLMAKDTVRYFDPAGILIKTYPAAYLLFYRHFNVYLQDPEFLKGPLDTGHVLDQVTVTGINYKKDSLMRRYLYRDIFDYKKPTLGDAVRVPKIGKVPIPVAIGVSVSGVLRWLQSKKNNQDERYQKFAYFSENESYINHRLSLATVSLYTGMQDDDSIHYLRNYYRPTAEALRNMNDLQLGQYLLEKAHDFRMGALPENAPSFTQFKNMYHTVPTTNRSGKK